MTPREKALFVLGFLPEVGRVTLAQVASSIGADDMDPGRLAALHPRVKRALGEVGALDKARGRADEQLKAAERKGAVILSVLDDRYPALLRATDDHPFFIYALGDLAALGERSIAVIGTREPTPHGELTAHRIAGHFVARGWTIISGLALGCDTQAHRAAIEAGGRTVAVLAHGLQTVAPAQNRALADAIVEKGGLLLTEYAFGVEPRPQQYVLRDRIQAGLSAGVVMAQSDERGGSLHASRAAIRYRRVLAVPVPTEADVRAGATRIGANLVLTKGSDADKAGLLKCELADLKRLFVLGSRDDYERLEAVLLSSGAT